MNSVYSSLGTTIFETVSEAARRTGAVNLGQGFPDDPGPEDVRRAAAEAVLDGWNQYPPMLGLPTLREAIAAHYAHHQDLAIDPMREVLVTSGATEAIAGALLALIEPGDEVILVEPMYDAYLPLVQRAGGVARFVTLAPPDWTIAREALDAAVTDRTRLILFNNPLNPAARVYTRDELAVLAGFCVAHDLIAICDEVWEHVVFDGRRHVPLIGLPGMRERTVKIGSAGQIFSLTGWKVGWSIAAQPILQQLAKTHQFLTFTTPPNLQAAVAYGLGKDDAYFTGMRAAFQRSRDRLADGLREIGLEVLPSEGSYFLNVDIALLGEMDDAAFALRLIDDPGVATIPVSAFMQGTRMGTSTLLRFCFAKKDATLDAALERLACLATRLHADERRGGSH
ncbi:MAG: aminotransferase [Thermomicrobiales bacterium]